RCAQRSVRFRLLLSGYRNAPIHAVWRALIHSEARAPTEKAAFVVAETPPLRARLFPDAAQCVALALISLIESHCHQPGRDCSWQAGSAQFHYERTVLRFRESGVGPLSDLAASRSPRGGGIGESPAVIPRGFAVLARVLRYHYLV